MNDRVPPWMLRELGRAEGGAQTLGVLIAGQRTRRLLLVRLLLDAVRAAPPTVLAPSAAALAREHWALLEAADRAAPDLARATLYYPLVGPWAERCVRLLTTPPHEMPPAPADQAAPRIADDLAHLGGLAVVAAARAGIGFRALLAVRDGWVPLPALGALRIRPHAEVPPAVAGPVSLAGQAHPAVPAVPAAPTGPAAPLERVTRSGREPGADPGPSASPGPSTSPTPSSGPGTDPVRGDAIDAPPRTAGNGPRGHPPHAPWPPDVAGPGPDYGPRPGPGRTVEVRGADGVLTVIGPGLPPVVLRPDGHGGWRSDDPRWHPAHALEEAPHRVVLDDSDPYRAVDNALKRHGLFAFGTLTPGEREQWQTMWRAALPMLTVGGQRPLVDAGLLDCVVPMTRPPEVPPRDGNGAHSSGTRREAFGAVLASAPSGPASLAATLVHELHHAKLSAVSDLVPLHTANSPRHYWAPWRPDARPFDGLLQGAYAHLALADYWQRVALAPVGAELRDQAWAEHARCREQVGAILPTLSGSHQLTEPGRMVVNELAALHTRMKGKPPPARYLARAAAYVETARLTWRRQHTR
ncbi:aKG-HExxH-type peptide beta-hydroxylase [Streptomyces zagrosensis]|uniref:HEXXH motif domain-containing protein n=1 Tax=Streptomyces zagrosensis TaxID=1042984 RepID=A0A7W9QAY9_9ACTN|nr:HEXXH motif-containing putative peptide modification protein [Streptomyces zagrosensis]MBB5936923.1 hypothetical protein [Streptomyces zagrosensis]